MNWPTQLKLGEGTDYMVDAVPAQGDAVLADPGD